jgi:beta-lactamase class A
MAIERTLRGHVLTRSGSIAAAGLALVIGSATVAAAQTPRKDFGSRVAALEHEAGGRIGLAALDTAGGTRLEYRAHERFALCSTFKLLLAAAVLSKIDHATETPGRHVAFGRQDLEQYAPVVGAHVQDGFMTVEALCAAVVVQSDNSAANLLLQTIGGPPALTAYLRSIGDRVTRLDRTEPSLNANLPGDERDTTTPGAMLDTMRNLLLADVLSPASQGRLQKWLAESKTGLTRLRAGINGTYRVGDKTGSGANGATNDVAIVWPGPNPPFLIAVYYTGSTATPEVRDSVLSSLARMVSREFGHP